MKLFLTLKHWQLFGIAFLPIIVLLTTLVCILIKNETNQLFCFSYFYPILTLFSLGNYLGWFYSVGISLYQKLPSTAKMGLTQFKFLFVFPIIYIVFGYLIISNRIEFNEPHIALFFFIIPFHLLSMFCISYCINFIAKGLKTVERQENVDLFDYWGEVLLIWFFFIGVWVIQPRINAIFQKETIR